MSKSPLRLRLLGALLSVNALAQTSALPPAPVIGEIEFFGLQKVPRDKILKALGVQIGSPLPSSKGDAELRLGQVSGVAAARLEGFCCEAGKAILYVGIEERGSPHFEYRLDPDADIELPDEILSVYDEVMKRTAVAAREGLPGEDLTQGHALAAHPATRESQLKLPELAEKHKNLLRNAVRTAADPDTRLIAVTVLPYLRRKFEIVDDLLWALKDSDPPVRAAAVRGLTALNVRAQLDPDSEIKIPSTWFIEMLNSLSFSDRDQAARMLVELSEERSDRVMIQLRERAMPALIDMASLKKLEHSLPPFVLLGRVLGLPEKEIQAAWARNEREAVIQLARQSLKKRDRE